MMMSYTAHRLYWLTGLFRGRRGIHTQCLAWVAELRLGTGDVNALTAPPDRIRGKYCTWFGPRNYQEAILPPSANHNAIPDTLHAVIPAGIRVVFDISGVRFIGRQE